MTKATTSARRSTAAPGEVPVRTPIDTLVGHLQTAVEAERGSQFAYFRTQHLTVLGTLDRIDGRLDAARARAAEALEVAQRLGIGWMEAAAECLLGRLSLTTGEAGEAERHVHDALGRLVAGSIALDIPECLDILAAVAAAQDSYEEAARLLGAAAAGREQLGIVRFPPEPEFWAGVERTASEALGDAGYSAAFAAERR